MNDNLGNEMKHRARDYPLEIETHTLKMMKTMARVNVH